MLSDLQCLSEIEALELPPSKLVEANEEVIEDVNGSQRQNNGTPPYVTGSRSPFTGISWLRRCTSKMFSLSPGKSPDDHPVQDLNENEQVASEQGVLDEPSKASFGNDAELSFAVASGSVDVDRLDGSDEAGQDISFDNQSNLYCRIQEGAEGSQPTDTRNGKRQPRKRGRPKVSRTRTMKQVVKDAETILGRGVKITEGERPNGAAEDSAFTNPESREESSLAEKGRPRNARKRNHDLVSEQVADDEGHSDSIISGQRGKRRQRHVMPVEPRYNLRRR